MPETGEERQIVAESRDCSPRLHFETVLRSDEEEKNSVVGGLLKGTILEQEVRRRPSVGNGGESK